MMRSSLFAGAAMIAAAVSIAAADDLAPTGAAPVQPPAIAPSPVTETLYGHAVTDTYRGMEALDPATIAWMKTQGAYTGRVMAAIPGRADLARRVSAFTGSFGFINNYARFGGREFYELRAPGADNYDLVVRDAQGTRKIVDIAAVMAAHGGKPFAINYITPSPDGAKVAVGLSEGGSEDAMLTVYDAATGQPIAGPIDRAEDGVTSWSADSKRLYFIRLKALKPTDPGTEKYRDASLTAWDLASDPHPLYGSQLPAGPKFGADETPVLVFIPGATIAALVSVNGVQNEYKLWLAPAAGAADPATAKWTQIADRDDGVTALDAKGDTVYLLSHKNAPTFQVLALKAGQPLSSAKVLVAADPGRVITSVHAAADGLYVAATRGVYSELLRVDYKTGAAEIIPLPARGHVGDMFTDQRAPGATLEFSSWVVPPTEYRYDAKTKKFVDLALGARGDIDPAQYAVDDLKAPAKDGTLVLLSLMHPANVAKPGIVVVEAYGSYGISNLADYSSRRAIFAKEGMSYGVCHVRGGGELGDAWRLAGKDANKHNTWQDLIACGDFLVKTGVTTPAKLFIMGGSAGGITMGRAMEERPDLFAGVIDAVPSANPLREEFTPNGPDNIPEFGTITKPDGFDNLWAMDSVQHVVPGTHYPAIMISTGLNDPRVAPWVPAKFAATLLAANPSSPVLLRIDAQAGHGIGSTRSQTDALTADWIAFVRWRAGEPGWQPVFTKP